MKYRLPGNRVRLPVEQIGFHPNNRDGAAPNGSRCLQLFKEILADGYDADEANFGGICVQSPAGSRAIHDFNVKSCAGDPLLAPVAAGFIAYGSLSHSHLHQILRNVRGCLRAEVGGVTDGAGLFSLENLRAKDPDFATSVEQGLRWEVLSPAIEVEEPDGCDVIQSACNAKNSKCMMKHEMQAVARVMKITGAFAAAEHTIGVQATRAQLAKTLPEYAMDPHFLELFKFVVDLGGVRGPFLRDLRTFHEKFVDPMLRRVHLHVFQILNALPVQLSHLKVAGAKFVYACPAKCLKYGYCEVLTAKMVKQLLKEEFENLVALSEEILRWFHFECTQEAQEVSVVISGIGGTAPSTCSSGATAGGVLPSTCGSGAPAASGGPVRLDSASLIQLLGNLDRDVFQQAVGFGTPGASGDPNSRSEGVLRAARKAYDRLPALAPGQEPPPFPWRAAPLRVQPPP